MAKLEPRNWLKRAQKDGRILRLGWGVGSLGTITMVTAVSNLYLFFLISVMKVHPATAGLLIFISKLFDMITDPAVGIISDKTNTRWGRRRPFMLVGAFLSPIALVILFNPISAGGGMALEFFVLGALLFYALALTLFNVPYLAMPAEMTDDYHERSTIMSYRAAFLVGGGFIGGSLAGPIIAAFGGGRQGYAVLGLVLGAVVMAAMLTTVLMTKTARFTEYKKPSISWKNQARLFFVNRPFLMLSAAKALQFLQLAAGGASTLFFFVMVLERDESLLFPFGVSAIAGSLISLRFWLPIIRTYGKKTILIGSLLGQAVLHLSWVLSGPAEPMALFIVRAFLLGTMGGAVLICSQSMIVDTIEYDRRLSGINREGLYSSVFSFVEKSMHATGPLIIGVLLAAFGYDASIPRTEAQPESALFAIYMGQAGIPAMCSLLMAAVIYFYSLDKKLLDSTTRHALGEREHSAPASSSDVNSTKEEKQ